MTTNKKFLASGVFAFLFFFLILLLNSVDVAPIGPEGSCVGLSTLNGAFFNAFSPSKKWDMLANLLLTAAIASAVCYALLGLIQLIKTRSLLQVSPGVLLLGGLYLVTIIIYVLFDKFAINYRPVLEDGMLAASFPSSHIMATITYLGGSTMSVKEMTSSPRLSRLVRVLCNICIVLAVVARLLSGEHWLTDILGGILASGAMLFLFSALQDKIS